MSPITRAAKGLSLHDVNSSQWQTRYRAVDDTISRSAGIRDIKQYLLAQGSTKLQGVFV